MMRKDITVQCAAVNDSAAAASTPENLEACVLGWQPREDATFAGRVDKNAGVPVAARRLPALFVALRIATAMALVVLSGACGNSDRDGYLPRIVVKFAEGLAVGIEGRAFSISRAGDGDSEIKSRPGEAMAMTRAEIAAQAGALNRIVGNTRVKFVAPVFTGGGRGLRSSPEGQVASGEAGTADLGLYYSLILERATPQREIDALIADLLALKIVQTAYLAPVGEDPGMAVPRD